MRRLKSKDRPNRPHPSQLPARLNSFGRVMTQDEQKREWSKRGLCEDCGLIQISQRTNLFGTKREKLNTMNIEVRMTNSPIDADAKTVPGKVYKGICLQCNTLEYAKVKLGETDPRTTLQRDTVLIETRMIVSWDPSTPSRAFSSDVEDDVRTPPTRDVSHERIQASPRGMLHDNVDVIEGDHVIPKHKSSVPQSIGGCQRQLSDLSMIDFDTEPHLAHLEEAFSTNLGNIFEDESSYDMGRLGTRIRAKADDANHLENLPQATTADHGDRDQGAMERLEARIRSKTNAQNTETQYFAIDADQNDGKAEGDAMERLEARIRIKSETNVATEESGDAIEANLMKKPPLLSSGSNTIHNSESLGINVSTDRLRSDEYSFENSKLVATNMIEENKRGYSLDGAQAAGTRTQDNLPSVINMAGERLNIYEERIRRKNADSLIASAPNSHPVTPHAVNESVVGGSQPGTTIQGARLNLSERQILLKNHQPLPSDDFSATQNYKQNDSNFERLETSELATGINTPGMHSIDRSNLFERRLQEKSDRNESTNNPGLLPERYNNSGRLNVFEQRMQMKKSAEDNQNKIPKMRTEHESDADAKNELREVTKLQSCDDVTGFLRLHLDSLRPSTIVFAYESIQKIINAKIYDKSDGRHLFRSKVSWLKLLSSIMYKYFSDAEVSAGSLLTLWSIASYSSRHADEIISNYEIIESIVDCMEAHHDSQPVNEYGSGVICCLSLSKNSAILLEHRDGQIVHRLTDTLSSTSCSCANHINSIRGLCYLSTVFHRNHSEFVGRHLQHGHLEECPSAKSIEAVLLAMHQHPSHSLIQLEGFRFLCQLLSRDAIVDIKVFNRVVKGISEHIVSISKGLPRIIMLDEALMYLLSTISAYCSETIVETLMWCWKYVVLDIMSTNLEASTMIALHGCRFVYNLCCFDFLDTNIRANIGESGGIERVLTCMSTFEHRTDIVEAACGAIFALCYKEPSNKKKVLYSGGIEKIRGVLGVINNGNFDSENDESISLNMLACAALITLAIDKSVLQFIERLGIVESMSLQLEDDNNGIRESLRAKMQDLVNISTSPGVSFDDDMNEDNTYISLSINLKEVVYEEFNSNTILLMQAHTIKSMHTFSENSDIQQIGCKILASTFAMSKKPNINCLEAVVSLISSKDVMTIATAASACKNFCVAQSLSSLDAYESQRLQNSLVLSVEQLILALHVCKDDQILVEQVSSALWAIATVEDASILLLESNDLVSSLLGFIEKYQCVGCLGLLNVFFHSSVRTMDFLTDSLILACIKCLQSDDEEVARTSLNTILAIAYNGAFPAIEMMLSHHELLIGAVVECMFKFKSPLVVRAACSFFRSISLDNYYRFTICNLGGIGRVMDALKDFTNDETTSCKAIMALTHLISGCDAEILCSTNVANHILETMTIFKEDLLIQVNGADAIWHLASRDDTFKDILVEVGAVQRLSDAMAHFIISEQMTKVGILSLWSLSVPQHLKTKVVQNGLMSVVNGMSAHCSSEKVCEDGLGALKSMSSENIDSDDILDLVYSCMWLHSHHSSIQQASLAALVNLSVNAGMNQVSRIKNEELNTIVEMMRIHHDTKAVQDNAIILLRNLTFSPHNCCVLQGNQYLASLIRTAMTNFHDNFQGRAEDLLRILPQ